MHRVSISRLESRLKKAKLDDASSASETQAITAMVRILGLEKNNETGLSAIEKALQAAATEREAMKREVELKREEVELMAMRVRDISQKNAEVRRRLLWGRGKLVCAGSQSRRHAQLWSRSP
jgi:predicted  nucleic acid-binding Zn-ribbon protein